MVNDVATLYLRALTGALAAASLQASLKPAVIFPSSQGGFPKALAAVEPTPGMVAMSAPQYDLPPAVAQMSSVSATVRLATVPVLWEGGDVRAMVRR